MPYRVEPWGLITGPGADTDSTAANYLDTMEKDGWALVAVVPHEHSTATRLVFHKKPEAKGAEVWG